MSHVQIRIPMAAALCLLATAGCGNKGSGDEKAEAEKKALDAAAAALVEPVGVISAYSPFLTPPDFAAKYMPSKHNDSDRAMAAAANEIRHAANGAAQNVERANAAGTKDIEAALKGVAVACADAVEPEALAKCKDAVKALDDALVKGEAARTAAGATTKIPRVEEASITENSKKAIAGFLKAKGPGPAETAFITKRTDAAASAADVIAACQSAASEAEATQRQFEKADEPIRLVAVTHKMAIDSQCNRLSTAEGLRKDVADCKKKAKSTECKVTCGKAKNMLDDGLPAATFEPLAKDYAAICEK
ncbi:MAG: hypothetical protein U0441_21975 [Polyangiaceae bacterium]